jgi:hypothetical protein
MTKSRPRITSPCHPRVQSRGRRAAPHLVAQVVEHQLLVAGVDDVPRVGGAPFGGLLAGDDQPGGQAQRAIERRQLRRIAGGQIVVHRDHVHHPPRQRGGGRGQRRRQRLALAGRQLRHPAAQHRRGRHQLHVVGRHAQVTRRHHAQQREHPRHRVGREAGAQQRTQFAGRLRRRLGGAQRVVGVAPGARGDAGQAAPGPGIGQARQHGGGMAQPVLRRALWPAGALGVGQRARQAQPGRGCADAVGADGLARAHRSNRRRKSCRADRAMRQPRERSLWPKRT